MWLLSRRLQWIFWPSIYTSIFCHCLFCSQGGGVAATEHHLIFDITAATTALCCNARVRSTFPRGIPKWYNRKCHYIPHRRSDVLKFQFLGRSVPLREPLSEHTRCRIFGKHSREFPQLKVPRKINRKINRSIRN